MSLQMGWVGSPPYFCAATKTARDIASDYCNTPIGSLPCHKFVKHVMRDKDFDALPTTSMVMTPHGFFYALGLCRQFHEYRHPNLPRATGACCNISNETSIHDIFPANIAGGDDPISKRKLLKGEGHYLLFEMLLGFDFDGKRKTMWLEEEKRAKLLTILHSWLRAGSLNSRVQFIESELVVAKLRHAFIALPGGRGLLSPCNRLLKQCLPVVYFHWNGPLCSAIYNCRTILRESTSRPTRCRELVPG